MLQLQPGTSLAAGAYKVFTYTGALTSGASLDTSLAQTNGLTLSIDTSVPGEVWLVARAGGTTPTPVPTLGHAALVLLGLLMAALGLRGRRQA